jgi:hypothetical protein
MLAAEQKIFSHRPVRQQRLLRRSSGSTATPSARIAAATFVTSRPSPFTVPEVRAGFAMQRLQ